MSDPRTPRRAFTRTDVLASIVLLSLVAGAAAPGVVQAWEASNKVKCGSNLRQIGMAMRQYAIDDVRGGAYPRTLYDAATADTPVFATPYRDDAALGPAADADPFVTPERARTRPDLLPLVPYAPKPNDVTAALFHLLRQSDLTAEIFVCPSTGLKPLKFADGFGKAAYTNWPGAPALRDGLSYSFQNMYPNRDAVGRGFKWTDSLNSTFAIAADMNPGGEAVLNATPDMAVDDPNRIAANSHNHFGDGQNVLFADGSVRFVATVFEGPQRDNIYAYRVEGAVPQQKFALAASKNGGTVGSAYDAGDSVLVPTAEGLGQKSRPMPTEDEMRAQMRADEQARLERQRDEMLRDADAGLSRLEQEVRRTGDQLRSLPEFLTKSAESIRGRARLAREVASAARDQGDAVTAARAEAVAGEAERVADLYDQTAKTFTDGATTRP